MIFDHDVNEKLYYQKIFLMNWRKKTLLEKKKMLVAAFVSFLKIVTFSHTNFIIIPPAKRMFSGVYMYWNQPVCSFMCLSVCPSVQNTSFFQSVWWSIELHSLAGLVLDAV